MHRTKLVRLRRPTYCTATKGNYSAVSLWRLSACLGAGMTGATALRTSCPHGVSRILSLKSYQAHRIIWKVAQLRCQEVNS